MWLSVQPKLKCYCVLRVKLLQSEYLQWDICHSCPSITTGTDFQALLCYVNTSLECSACNHALFSRLIIYCILFWHGYCKIGHRLSEPWYTEPWYPIKQCWSASSYALQQTPAGPHTDRQGVMSRDVLFSDTVTAWWQWHCSARKLLDCIRYMLSLADRLVSMSMLVWTITVLSSPSLISDYVFNLLANWLPGKNSLRNDPLRVKWDVKPHTH